jgi:DNA-binding NarL/FixJ family response regulator
MSSEPIELHRRRVPHKTTLDVLHGAAAEISSVSDGSSKGVLIVDQRIFARDCLAATLRAARSNQPVETYSNVNELARNKSRQSTPSVILFCYHDSGGNEKSLDDELSSLAKLLPDVPIVMISEIEDASVINRALQLGARGYIPSNLPLKVVLQAIEIIEAGGTYLPVDIFLKLRNAIEQLPNGPTAITENLTTRQLAVLQALRQGKANKVIGFELSMRESTVKVHVRNIMKKLNARNRTEVTYITNGMFAENGNVLKGRSEPVPLRAVTKQLWRA